MKIERLIGIIFYLINRECVTTNELAQKFEVSRRTILRDIDTLTLAGIPIYSELGVKGGYAINKDFKVDEKIIDSNNKEYILLALNSLKTVYGNNKVIETYEKMKHLYSDVNINALPDVDFSVVTEKPHIMKCVDLINNAIKEQRTIKFIYTNSAGNTKEVFLNPLHTYYKWYSWYAFGYDTSKKDYHLFKVVRMKNISLTKELFQTEANIANLLSDFEKRRNQTNITVTLSYKQEIDTLVNEYFKGKIIETVNDCCIRKIEIKENDFMTFSILLGLSDKIKILSPQKYKERVLIHIGKIKKNFI